MSPPTALTSSSYSASLLSSNVHLTLHGPITSKHSTGYILALPSQEFTVSYSSLPTSAPAAKGCDLAVALDVGGRRLGMQRVLAGAQELGAVREGRFEGFRTGETTIKPFIFPALPSSTRTGAEEPLIISLKYYRIRIEGLDTSPKFLSAPSSSLGAARQAAQKEHLRYTWLDSRDKPFESIEFVCLSRQELLRRGFALPSREEIEEAERKEREKKGRARFKRTFVPATAQDPALTAAVPAVIPPPALLPPPVAAPEPTPLAAPAEDRLIITHVSNSSRIPNLSQPPTEEAAAVPALPTPTPSPAFPTPIAVAAPQAPQSALPTHLRRPSTSSTKQRRIPETPPRPPPRSAAPAPPPAPAPAQPPEDIKPLLPPPTPPKPSRALLNSVRGPPAPSPKTRYTALERENDALRLSIAELENARLKRRLQALRAEQEKEEGNAEVKRRRVVQGKQVSKERRVLECIVLD